MKIYYCKIALYLWVDELATDYVELEGLCYDDRA